MYICACLRIHTHIHASRICAADEINRLELETLFNSQDACQIHVKTIKTQILYIDMMAHGQQQLSSGFMYFEE